ncbi:MAG: DUF1007 family protein [Devosia sp.]
MRRLFALGALLLCLPNAPALAHPHIFIDATARIIFDAEGRVAEIHNHWVFDEAYSAWVVQGLDTDNDGTVTRAETQALADDNMVGLAEYQYYTFAGEGPDNLTFDHGSNPTIDFDGKVSTLSFDVALSQPYRIGKALEIAINDPEYYVAITFKDASAVELVNAPAGCTVRLDPPQTMPDTIADELYALPPDVTQLPPDLAQALRGVQGAIVVSCLPGAAGTGLSVAEAVPETALDAVTAMGEAQSAQPNAIPFGGPPPEPGFNLPRSGFFGWVAEQQRQFYLALTDALGRLKGDWTAFWVLGGLSFLYGIFHAAGPGHGKVVISSYVLASQQQVRRGVLLSFFAALMQSAVAVGFVLILSAVLGLTSMALSDAANWIGIVSYGLVALLGLWLVIRKLFGLGHSHHHHDDEPAPAEHLDIARGMQRSRAHALLRGDAGTVAFAKTGADVHGRLPDDPHYGHNHAPPGPGRAPHDHVHHHHAHVVTPDQLRGNWREQFGVVMAVGLRPCSGALVVLAFALSQGLLLAGVAAVFLMGLGTAITTGALAALAVGAKSAALRLAGRDHPLASRLVWLAELLGAVAVFAFGMVLLIASF